MHPDCPSLENDTMLQGKYECCHCLEACASNTQIRLWLCLHDGAITTDDFFPNLFFCTPECAAGYNLHLLGHAQLQRHALLEKKYNRHIVPAPEPEAMKQTSIFNRAAAKWRVQWLPECLAQLSLEEQQLAWKQRQYDERKEQRVIKNRITRCIVTTAE